MSSDAPPPPVATEAPGPPLPAPPILSAGERRVLAVLIEKAKTTPDAYPMSVNSLVTACNQKTNRDPLTSYTDLEAEEYLTSVQRKGLVIKTITGTGRVTRWRHELYSGWQVNKMELAVLGELLLRGPQTEGELRARASRMEPIDDLDALRPVLQTLAQRRFVIYLTPPGRRGTTLTHAMYEPAEVEALKSRYATAALDEDEATTRAPTPSAQAQHEVEATRVALAELQAAVAELTVRVARLEEKSGGQA